MKKERATRRNATGHPLQVIRTTCGFNQEEFAAILGISPSALRKRETFQAGFKDIPDELHRAVAHEFGAFIWLDLTKKIGSPGYYLGVTGVNHVPFTRDYAMQFRAGRAPLVKYPLLEVIRSLYVTGKLCRTFNMEKQFAEHVAFGLKGLCAAPRLRIALKAEIKKLIGQKKPVAAAWLCEIIGDDDTLDQLVPLPTQRRLAEKVKQLPRIREVFVNGKPV